MCPQNLQPSKMTEHVPSQLLSTQLLYIVTIISKGKKAWTCQGRMFSPDAVQILGFCRSPTNLHTYRDKSLDFDSILSNFETFRIDKNLQSSRFPTPYSSIALCHLRKIDNTWDPLNNTSLTSKLCRLSGQPIRVFLSSISFLMFSSTIEAAPTVIERLKISLYLHPSFTWCIICP